jgi:hypothetical protein
MALLPNINVGTSPNDGTGSSLRDAFTIVNENFQLIEAFFPNSEVANLNANIESTGVSTFNQIDANVIYSSTFGNAGAQYYGNIATASQPNVTSLGTLTELTVGGELTVTGNTSLQVTNVEDTLTANGASNFNGILTAGNTLVASADIEVLGAHRVNVNIVSGSYTVSNSDYILQANVTGDVNCSILLPNATSSTNRLLHILYYDRDATNANTTVVALNTNAGGGNIIVSPLQTEQTGFNWNNTRTPPTVTMVSNGEYWLLLS